MNLVPDEIVVGETTPAGAFPASALFDLHFPGVGIVDAAAFFESTLQRVSCRHLEPVRFLYGDMAPKRQKPGAASHLREFVGSGRSGDRGAGAVMRGHRSQNFRAARAIARTIPGGRFARNSFDRLRFQSRSGLGPWFARVHLRGLPQLFNVVRGEMSLVGPRPSRVEFGQDLSQQFPYLFAAGRSAAGVDGLGQIHRLDPPFDALTELEYDLYYIRYVSARFRSRYPGGLDFPPSSELTNDGCVGDPDSKRGRGALYSLPDIRLLLALGARQAGRRCARI